MKPTEESISYLKEYFKKNRIDITKNINSIDVNSMTALMMAAAQGHKEMVRMLILLGANIEAQNTAGTALMMAAKNGHTKIVIMLIKSGAGLHATDIDGNTALILTIRNGYAKIAESLIKAGANVAAKNNLGLTALFYGETVGIETLVIEKSYEYNNIAKKNTLAWVGAISSIKYLLSEYIPLAHYAKDLSEVKYLAQYENSLLSVAHVVVNLIHSLNNMDYYMLKPIHLLNPLSSSAAFLAKPYIYQYRDELLSSYSKDSEYKAPIEIASYIATDMAVSFLSQGHNMASLLSGATIGSINYYNSQEYPDSTKLSSRLAFITTTLALYSCYKYTKRTDALAIQSLYIQLLQPLIYIQNIL